MQSIQPKMTFFGHALRRWLLRAAVVGLVLGSLGLVVVRWFEIKRDRGLAPGVTYLSITGLSGGAEVPQPIDEWPPLRAAWLVYQRFRQLHPDVALKPRVALQLQGPAAESAVLMSMAGRTAGEIIAANCRVLQNWIDHDFLYPMDEYVLELARKNLRDRRFLRQLPTAARPAPWLDLDKLALEQIDPAWIEVDPRIWPVVLRPGKDGRAHVWAWPYETRTLALYYNRLIFAQQARDLESAGLDGRRAPRTWEELIDYCQALASAQTGTYGLLLDVWGVDPYQRDSVAHLIDLLWQAGAQIVERDPQGQWQFVWDRSQGTVDAIRFLRELVARRVRKDGVDLPLARIRTAERWSEAEEFGRVRGGPAMCWDYSSSLMAVKAFGQPETIGIAPLPAGPVQFVTPAIAVLRTNQAVQRLLDGPSGLSWDQAMELAASNAESALLNELRQAQSQYAHPSRPGWLSFPGGRAAPVDSLVNFGDGWRIRAAQLDASMFCITRLATDKARRDAAWRYISFLSSREARGVRTDLMVETGSAMLLNPDCLAEFGYEDLYEAVPTSWRQALPGIRRSGRPTPNGPNCQYIHRVLARMADSALLLTPAEQRARLAENLSIRSAWRTGKSSASTEAERDAAGIRAWASESVDYGTRRLLNELPPEQLSKARRLGAVAAGVVAVAFPVAMWVLLRGSRPSFVRIDSFNSAARLRWRGAAKAWLLMAPAVGSILMWQYYPLTRGAVMAFQDYRIMQDATDVSSARAGGARWVGLDNFARVFTEPTTRQAAWNTLLFVALSLGLGFFTPILLAIMLDELPRGSLAYRIIYNLPAAMGSLVVAYLWAWFYSPQPDGLLNVLVRPFVPAINRLIDIGSTARAALLALLFGSLSAGGIAVWAFRRAGVSVVLVIVAAAAGLLLWLGMQPKVAWPVSWLSSGSLLAMVCVILPMVWAGLGPGCIIYLAALKSIPEEMYEAADIDGAGPGRKAFSVTLPLLKPLIIIQFVGAFIGAFRSWETVFVMTAGGPKDATLVLGMEIWYNAFAYLRFGYATALGWMLGAMLIGFTVFQLRVLRSVRFGTAARP